MKLTDIKLGDIVVYKEDGANSLNEIIYIDGVLYPKPLVIDYNGYIDLSDKPFDSCILVPLASYFDENSWLAVDDSFDINDPLEYMNRILPL